MGETIDPNDLKLECWPIEGIDKRGGQHAGSEHMMGVRITHLPSGIMAYANVGRSQHKNKAIAMDMIVSAITHPCCPKFYPTAQRASKEGREDG